MASYIDKWSDEELARLREKVRFDLVDEDLFKIKTIIIRFFNAYFTGTIPQEDSLIATVHDAVSISRVYTNFIFLPGTGESCSYSSNKSSPEELATNIRGSISKSSNIITFRNKIKEILDNFCPSQPVLRDSYQLMSLTGYLALFYCRFAVKNKNQMVKAAAKNKMSAKLTRFCDWPEDWGYELPIDEFLNLCASGLKNNLKETCDLFKIVVHEGVLSLNPDHTKLDSRGYLSASLLTHTAWYELGMMELLTPAQKISFTSIEQLSELVRSDETINSLILILDFFIRFFTITPIDRGYCWARLIDSEYLKGYSCEENMYLCVIFAGIIEKEQGPGIWSAKWIKNSLNQYTAARAIGNRLYENRFPTQKETEEMLKIVQSFKNFHH